MLFGAFLAWVALSAVIIGTDLIEPPARGVFFRLCFLATPFAVAAGVAAPVMLIRRRDRIRAAEVQRADALRAPRV